MISQPTAGQDSNSAGHGDASTTLEQTIGQTPSASKFFSDQRAAIIQAPTSSNRETDLLRHFRYNLSPWIDVGDPECPFGIKILLLARSKRSLCAAILALSARQRSLIARPQNHRDDHDLENSVKFREEAEHGLAFEEDLVRHVGQAILMLGDFFASSPLQWRNLLFYQMGVPDGIASLAALEDGELSEPLFWLRFRIGTMHLGDFDRHAAMGTDE